MKNKDILTLVSLGIILFVFTRPDHLPDMNLPVHKSGVKKYESRTVGGACDAEQCLTVYVSPSCPTSPRITSMLISLVDDLKKDNIQTDIIVGNDPAKEVKYFAKRYPFGVFLDPSGNFFQKADLEFTPTFIVTNREGEILTMQSRAFQDPALMRSKLEL